MVQSLMEEEEEREKHMATSKQVAAVQGTVDQVLSRLTNFSQSQATTNTQLDAALVQVANGQTAMLQAAEVMTASAGQGKRPSGSAIAEPPPKRGNACGAVLPVSAGTTAGGGAASTEIRATVDFHSALVHDWTMPAEMLTATFVSQPLFEQLIELVKLCHVSVGKQGLFVSHACLKVYEEGVTRTAEVVRDGGTAGVINAEKTERMRNVVKNKVKLYIKQIHWLQSLLPRAIKAPDKATFEDMQSFSLSADERTRLTDALNDSADAVGWPPNHPIRTPTKARINTLRTLLGALARRVPTIVTNADIIFGTPPFDKLLATATENVRKKYT